VEKAKSDLAALESTYEDAKENLELFESSVGDGYFYASEDGTILRTMVRAEQALTSDAVVFVYSNPKELTVTVSVDQADIAKLTVGDSAYVQSSAGSGFTGDNAKLQQFIASQVDAQTAANYNKELKQMKQATLDGEATKGGMVLKKQSSDAVQGAQEEQNSLNGGLIAGIVLVAFVVMLLILKKKRKK
jgi:hypothetical protein